MPLTSTNQDHQVTQTQPPDLPDCAQPTHDQATARTGPTRSAQNHRVRPANPQFVRVVDKRKDGPARHMPARSAKPLIRIARSIRPPLAKGKWNRQYSTVRRFARTVNQFFHFVYPILTGSHSFQRSFSDRDMPESGRTLRPANASNGRRRRADDFGRRFPVDHDRHARRAGGRSAAAGADQVRSRASVGVNLRRRDAGRAYPRRRHRDRGGRRPGDRWLRERRAGGGATTRPPRGLR